MTALLDRLNVIPKLSFNDIYRFWGKVAIKSDQECWLWLAYTNRDGYGEFGIKLKRFLTHRVSYWLHFREQPTRLVCHKCDVPGCVNPHHLIQGTQSENMQDCVNKGRNAMCTTARKFDTYFVYKIRQLYADGLMNQLQLAEIFNVNISTIESVCNHRGAYAHI